MGIGEEASLGAFTLLPLCPLVQKMRNLKFKSESWVQHLTLLCVHREVAPALWGEVGSRVKCRNLGLKPSSSAGPPEGGVLPLCCHFSPEEWELGRHCATPLCPLCRSSENFTLGLKGTV